MQVNFNSKIKTDTSDDFIALIHYLKIIIANTIDSNFNLINHTEYGNEKKNYFNNSDKIYWFGDIRNITHYLKFNLYNYHFTKTNTICLYSYLILNLMETTIVYLSHPYFRQKLRLKNIINNIKFHNVKIAIHTTSPELIMSTPQYVLRARTSSSCTKSTDLPTKYTLCEAIQLTNIYMRGYTAQKNFKQK